MTTPDDVTKYNRDENTRLRLKGQQRSQFQRGESIKKIKPLKFYLLKKSRNLYCRGRVLLYSMP
jgi:hypothetical protein